MEVEGLLQIFDRCWFESDIFDTRKSKSSDTAETVPNDNLSINHTLSHMLSRVPTVLVRSKSEQLESETIFSPAGSVSPNSVLRSLPGAGKLKSIPSGKEARVEEGEEVVEAVSVKERRKRTGRREGKRTTSKSMSELEFEEVKGFMDLGFVFSEEDKDSSLAEIIPGLHQLGKVPDEEKQGESGTVSRPYLSESWEWWERRKEEEEEERRRQLSMHWEVPASGNASDIKRSLRLWAHNVASAVR
ncbi:hypothetical protein MLD38_019285 [Melastoma candidum]|uniref:Uncharacterized protein n=1 Tax=Melastoma candidum TaxID=119954 RepID=A0ACB9QWI2_9MYRT|nr:hypothetical protein MLD38_019285 [Melastoma candidum]